MTLFLTTHFVLQFCSLAVPLHWITFHSWAHRSPLFPGAASVLLVCSNLFLRCLCKLLVILCLSESGKLKMFKKMEWNILFSNNCSLCYLMMWWFTHKQTLCWILMLSSCYHYAKYHPYIHHYPRPYLKHYLNILGCFLTYYLNMMTMIMTMPIIDTWRQWQYIIYGDNDNI